MSTAAAVPDATGAPPPVGPHLMGLVPYRFTVSRFLKMADAGVFPEGVHAELLGGIVVAKTEYEPRDFCVGMLGDLLRPQVPAGYFLREEKSVCSGNYWLPEPEITIALGTYKRSLQAPEGARPSTCDRSAEFTYRNDRGVKWAKYAAPGIPAYWIVNLDKGGVEVFAQPKGAGKSTDHDQEAVCQPGQQVPVILDGRELGLVAIAEVLPRSQRVNARGHFTPRA